MMEESYRIYMSDELRLGHVGKAHVQRWCDIVHPKKDWTPEEVIDDLVRRMNESA